MKKAETDNRPRGSFEEMIRQKLQQVPAEPKQQLWDRLEQSLTEDPDRVLPAAGLHRFRWWLLAALLLFVASGILTYQQLQAPGHALGPTLADAAPPAAGTPHQTAAAGNPKKSVKPADPAQSSTAAVAEQAASPAEPTVPPSAENKRTDAGQPAAAKKVALQATRSAAPGKKPRTLRPEETAAGLVAMSGKPGRSKRTKEKAGPTLGLTAANPTRHSKGKLPPIVVNAENRAANRKAEGAKQTEGATVAMGDSAQNDKRAAVAAAPALLDSAARLARTSLSGAADTVADTLGRPLPVAELMALPADTLSTPAPSQKQRKQLLTVGIMGGPAYFHQNIRLSERSLIVQNAITPLALDPLYEAAAKDFDANTHSAFSWKAGVVLGKEIFTGFKLETGLSYARFAATTTCSYLVADTGSGPLLLNPRPLLLAALSSWESNMNSRILHTENYKLHSSYSYLQVPLQLQIFKYNLKWRYFAGAGLEAARLLESKITTDHPLMRSANLAAQQEQYFRPWLWTLQLSAGASYRLTEKLALQGSGNIGIGLTPVTAVTDIKGVRQHGPRTINLAAGITYTFFGN